jgi:hypothetical protein
MIFLNPTPSTIAMENFLKKNSFVGFTRRQISIGEDQKKNEPSIIY